MSELTPEAQVIENMFHIQSKTGKKVPFLLNPSQTEYDKKRTIRDLIPKARQKGFSSLGIAYQSVDCLGKEGTRAVLISHEAKATQRLLDKARFYFQYIEGPQPELGRHSRNEFYFPKTESTFYIGTAGAKAFGRGDTITHLHISEYAWWESDGLKQIASLFQAVPKGGTIRIESTGNGKNNDFFYMCTNPELLGYQVNFRSWHEDPEYTMPLPEAGWNPEGFEHYFEDMKLRYQLDEDQLYWYYLKLLEFRLDLNMMQQEYPSCLEECFQATGGAIFPVAEHIKTTKWTWKLENQVRIEYHEDHPRQDRTYCIGADPSGGTGNDDAGMQIFCLETFEQVLEFGSNNIDPVDFGHTLASYGGKYNEAYIICEGNHHGIATHSILKKEYTPVKIYKRLIPHGRGKIKYGFMTTKNTKAELVGAIKECIELGLSLYGPRTVKQMQMFEEDPETGVMGGKEDDLVIALGLVCVGLLKYQRFAIDLTPPPKPEPVETYEGVNLMVYTFEDLFDKKPKPVHFNSLRGMLK